MELSRVPVQVEDTTSAVSVLRCDSHLEKGTEI